MRTWCKHIHWQSTLQILKQNHKNQIRTQRTWLNNQEEQRWSPSIQWDLDQCIVIRQKHRRTATNTTTHATERETHSLPYSKQTTQISIFRLWISHRYSTANLREDLFVIVEQASDLWLCVGGKKQSRVQANHTVQQGVPPSHVVTLPLLLACKRLEVLSHLALLRVMWGVWPGSEEKKQ